MSLTPEQIAELQVKANLADQLQKSVQALEANREELLAEKANQRQRLEQLTAQEQERETKRLQEEGNYKELLEMANNTIADLKRQLEEKDKDIEKTKQMQIQDQIRADFASQFNSAELFDSKGAWATIQAWGYEFTKAQNGQTVAVINGQQFALADLKAKLRSSPDSAWLFRPSNNAMGGMSARPGQTTEGGAPPTNPYLPGGRLSDRLQLEIEDPDLAARMRTEAENAQQRRG